MTDDAFHTYHLALAREIRAIIQYGPPGEKITSGDKRKALIKLAMKDSKLEVLQVSFYRWNEVESGWKIAYRSHQRALRPTAARNGGSLTTTGESEWISAKTPPSLFPECLTNARPNFLPGHSWIHVPEKQLFNRIWPRNGDLNARLIQRGRIRAGIDCFDDYSFTILTKF